MPEPFVLVVDDDADLREVIGDTLARKGVSSVLAGSLGELQAQSNAALACRMAVVDINLGPEQPNGVEVARWLESRGFDGKIVFLTGFGQTDRRVVEAANLAGAEVLTKPITTAQLALLVDAARTHA